MDNPSRTAAYLALLETRRSELKRSLAEIFPAHEGRPVVLEVGSGHGHFLAAYAAANPGKRCIGVDIERDRVERAVRKRDRARLDNLFFVHADARQLLEALPPTIQISEVFILFPDPWPKLRHHKHRILQPGFLSRLATRASADCRLAFRTDHQPYFESARRTLAAHPDWELTADAWPFEFATVFQSRAPIHFSWMARHRGKHDPISSPDRNRAVAN